MINKKIAVAAILLSVAALISAALLVSKKYNEVAFKIDGIAYDRQYVSALADVARTQRKVSRAEAAQQIYQYYRGEAAAKSANLTPDSALVASFVSVNIIPLHNYAPSAAVKVMKVETKRGFYRPKLANFPTPYPYANIWLDLVSQHDALEQSYVTHQQGIYKGYLFAFYYGDRILAEDHNVPVPGHGNASLIAADEGYAKQQATFYHDQIKNKVTEPASVLQMIKSNLNLGAGAKSVDVSTINSGAFDNTVTPDLGNQVYHNEAVQYIEAQSKPGLSPVLPAFVTEPKQKPIQDAYFFVVITQASKQTDAKSQIQRILDKQDVSYHGL